MNTGYLVLADVTGYTAYLAGVELEHGQAAMREILDLVSDRLRALLRISARDGDAIFAYAAAADIPRGESLLETLEATYVEFKDLQANIRRRTTCDCRACEGIPALDLKFMTHYGQYAEQTVDGQTTLVGLDVNLIRHRLLKTAVVETTGWQGFAAFTADSLTQMGLQPAHMHAQTETYASLGQITTYSLNLQARYEALVDDRRAVVPAEAADLILSQNIPAPPARVWEWLNDPHKRNLWQTGRVWSAGLRPDSRTAPGARNHCVHAWGDLTETVLDWRPYEYYTVALREPWMAVMQTVLLQAAPGGTRVHTHLKLQVPLPKRVAEAVARLLFIRALKMDQAYATLARLVAEQAPAAAGLDAG